MSVAPRQRRPDRRHSASHPCPVCGGHDDARRGQGERCHGFVSGEYVHCAREECAGRAKYHEGSKTFAHKATGTCPCGQEHRPAEAKPGSKAGMVEEATYDYRDRAGKLLYQVVRFKPKTFRQRRPLDGGGFAWGVEGVPRVLYRLPELVAADAAQTVFIVEGEKDADRLGEVGLVATTNSGGAGKWKDAYSHHLRGREVVILPDGDRAGRDHARDVTRSLRGIARSVKVVELPGLPEKGDVSDWLILNTIADLTAAVAEASAWAPATVHADPPPTIPIRRTVDDPGSPGLHLTDLGNAERLIRRHGDDIRYCHPWKKWLVFDGKRWAVDDTGAARRRAKEATRAIHAEAAAEADDASRKALGRHALDTERRDRQSAMLQLAEMDRFILPAAMDLDPWAFNVLNGTIDLRSGELRPHRREDFITQLCRLRYDPGAGCPLWLDTLRLFFAGDEGMIAYFQRVCGYAMTGVIRDHLLPVAHGIGSNGKSTMLGAIMEVFGADYAMKASPDLLMVRKNDGHPTDRADLFGKRLVVAIETEEGRRLNETLVKELTGGDRIRARRMREDPWEFSPTHTLILATNHKPVIKGTDNGIWRRLRLIPFNVRVEGREEDKAMPEKLRAERAGILAWCVRGCLRWQAEGLESPGSVVDATAEYRASQDVIGAFIDEHCLVRSGVRAKASRLYERYRQWADKSGESPKNQRNFGMAMTERGFEKFTNNGTWYRGIGLNDVPDF